MLKAHNSSAIVAVTDLARARAFYGDTLGLALVEDTPQTLTFATGDTRLVVYPSEFAGSNRANAVVWGVHEDLERIVADLVEKGVTFEHYADLPGVDLKGDIHHFGDFKGVWFKDPDGNLLHLNSM